MDDTWLTHVSAALASAPTGLLLALGPAGLRLYEHLPPGLAAKTVLVSPDPAQIERLKRENPPCPDVSIMTAAVAGTDGTATLRRFNLPDTEALRDATGLDRLFPGLRETRRIDVRTMSIETILEEVDLAEDVNHTLILGASGEEMTVIEQLSARGWLHRFSLIAVQLPSALLYRGAASGAEIRARLEGESYRIAFLDPSDADLPFAILHLDRDRQALLAARAAAETRLNETRAQISELQGTIAALHQSQEDSARERDEIAAERNAEAEARAAAEAEAKEARETIEKHRTAAERARVVADTYRHALRLEAREADRPADPDDDEAPALRDSHLDPPKFKPNILTQVSRNAADHAGHRLVLDVKSVPRSGLHYMKRTFERILGSAFSFCEWYQEPGCCRRMPCIYSVEDAGAAGTGSLRMLKSHDFDLDDPVYPVTPGLRRLILTREPIFVLTSNWFLQSLDRNKELLERNDIRLSKIFYLHEPAMLQKAYNLLEMDDPRGGAKRTSRPGSTNKRTICSGSRANGGRPPGRLEP